MTRNVSSFVVLPRKDERVFPPMVSVSPKGERAGDIFAEIIVRFTNSLPLLHRLLLHLTDESDHAACSRRGNEALDTEKSTTS